jgi:tetratricopeptide (TPR) repeat protein
MSDRKDGWDKLSALSGFLSAVVIGVVGVFFTQAYKSREIHIAEAQAVEKFLPYLVGTDETAKNGAVMAIATLGNTELAARLGVSFASAGTIDALEYLLKNTQRDSKALVRQALVRAYVGRTRDIIYNNKNLDQALKDYARIHALEPDDRLAKDYENTFLANLYNDEGNAYDQKGESSLALDYYNKALQVLPKDEYILKGVVLSNIATVYAKQENFIEAHTTFDKAFEAFPKGSITAVTYGQRGWFYLQQDMLDKAIEDFKNALAIRNDLGFAFLNLMFIYAKKDDASNAARELIRVRGRLTDPKLQARLDQDLERVSEDAGHPDFGEKVKQEMEKLKVKILQEEPRQGKTEAKQ